MDEIHRAFGRKRTGRAILEAKPGLKSARRSIGSAQRGRSANRSYGLGLPCPQVSLAGTLAEGRASPAPTRKTKWSSDGTTAQRPDRLAFPLCASKKRELAINSEDLANMYIIESNAFSKFLVAGQSKKRGGKNEGIFHYVIEKKWWKNVRNRPFHYVHENKGGYGRLSIMLMKRKAVNKRRWMKSKVRSPRSEVRSLPRIGHRQRHARG